MSAQQVRSCVARYSGKEYFDNSSQQDAEEFMHFFCEMILKEMEDTEAFAAMKWEIFGKEQIRRVFTDTPTVSCQGCGKFPSTRETEFLCLKLALPSSAVSSINALSSVINDHFEDEL